MFASYMINAWEAATIVAVVAGVVGFFRIILYSFRHSLNDRCSLLFGIERCGNSLQ